MLIEFFLKLRQGGVPASIKEFLVLIEALEKQVAFASVEDFYFLARTCLVKDEKFFDRYDLVFAAYFKGVVGIDAAGAVIPEEWLRKLVEKHLTDEEKKLIQSLGGWDKLMETLKKRLEEQKGRHQGGSKWIGTGGTSPFGAYGYNPEGIRIGQHESRHRRAVKVWDQREFRNLDDTVELGTRNIKVALRKLRKFARTGAPEELDMEDTIRSTAKNAGWLDLENGAGAAQCGESAVVPRYRRFDGRPHPRVRAAVFSDAHRVQAPRVFLFPQLPVRARVEGQPSPRHRTHGDLGRAAQVSA